MLTLSENLGTVVTKTYENTAFSAKFYRFLAKTYNNDSFLLTKNSSFRAVLKLRVYLIGHSKTYQILKALHVEGNKITSPRIQNLETSDLFSLF